MARVSYPSGDTTASRVKTLALWVESNRGRSAREMLLHDLKLDPEYLSDETRPLPIPTYAQALQLFVARFGQAAMSETWTGVLHEENLAVWTRVLRGVGRPEDALAQLDVLEAEERHTCAWETLGCHAGYWRGQAILAHDPIFEQDGLWALARAAELAAIPAMFGLGPGVVEIGERTERLREGTNTTEMVQPYVLRWRVPTQRRILWLSLGGFAGTAPLALANPSWLSALVVIVAVLGGAGIGQAWYRGARRSAESYAQNTRIRALERGVALKEQREKLGLGFGEGALVAGKYRLGRKLGSGASGVIHEAARLADNAPVAVKLLRAAVAHDGLASDRLRRESEALGLTWHPNVVEIYEYDYLPDGTAYLVMELLRGESLAARLRRVGHLATAEVASIALQVCDALGAVHAAGVIHRDVKPSNIFLATSPDGRERVKVLDFGIARVEWAETRLTDGGSPVGTPGYMSPEQETGEDIDKRSDLYGVGAVLYECLAGVPPPVPASGSFSIRPTEGGSGSQLEQELVARLPPDWLQIVRRAMAARPNDRYPDARAMSEAIVEIVQPEATGERFALSSTPPSGEVKRISKP